MEKEQLLCGRRKIQINCVLNPPILFYFVKCREDHSKWLYDNSLRILLLYENIFVTCIVYKFVQSYHKFIGQIWVTCLLLTLGSSLLKKLHQPQKYEIA